MQYPRRYFLASGLGALAVGCSQLEKRDVPVVAAAPSENGIPGPYPGRVVSVSHPGSIIGTQFQREPVGDMMRKGMMELTGADSPEEAWRSFFEPGDIVGLKLNPVGKPHIISAPEVVREIIDGLHAAGIKAPEIVAYDRYRSEFIEAGFDKWLPDGVRWMAATDKVGQFQLDMDGYDPDQYMEMALVLPKADAGNAHHRRSYVARFLTREVNKMINLTVLKHHQSAGVTLALKNMSHGLVNNVSRSHSSRTLNACGTFIPAVVDLPVIRQKVVLNIVDGIQAGYHGGPLAKVGKYMWNHQTIYFSTDPVAIDKVGWGVIDRKRVEKGMLPVGEAPPDADSTFYRMQPEHIEIAGALGLGVYKDIDLREFRLVDVYSAGSMRPNI